MCMPCSSLVVSEILPEIHIGAKFDFFFKSMIHSKIIKFSVYSGMGKAHFQRRTLIFSGHPIEHIKPKT